MDDLDFRILREIRILAFWGGPREPGAHKPAAIARRLGLTAKTVNERLALLREEGCFRGYALRPNPASVGLTESLAYFWLEPGSELRAKHALANVEGVERLLAFFGGGLAAGFFWRDEAERARRLHAIETALERSAFALFDWRTPRPPLLSSLDRRLLLALRNRVHRRPPSESLHEVADEIGVSLRTAKRHHDRMAQAGAFDVEGDVAACNLRGSLFVSLVVTPRTRGAGLRGAVMRVAPPWTFFDAANDEGQVLLMIRCRAVGEASRVADDLLGLPGIARVDVLCQSREEPAQGVWLDEALARGDGPRAMSVRADAASRDGRAFATLVHPESAASR